jgi:hypothetical protein
VLERRRMPSSHITLTNYANNISHRLYSSNSYPEGVVCSPAKSFIGQPINIKIPIPVAKIKANFTHVSKTYH